MTPATVVRAAAGLLGLDNAAITLGGTASLHLIGVHGPLAMSMEDLQRALGQGPTLSALARNSPVIATATEAPASRWPAFDAGALDAGVTSVLALPFRPRREPPIALSLYNTTSDVLDDDQIGDALLVTDMIAEALIDPSPDGLHQRLAQVGDDSTAVHHATGIMAARHSLSPAEALSSLRSQAAATGTTVSELAAQITRHRH